MPDSEERRRGPFAAGLLAGVSVLALAGGALAAGSTAPRYEIVVPDLSVQLADSGESGKAWPTVDLPATASMSPQELNAAIARYEIAALAFR